MPTISFPGGSVILDIVSSSSPTTGSMWVDFRGSDNKIVFFQKFQPNMWCFDVGNRVRHCINNVITQPNRAYKLAYVFTKTTLELYLDGSLEYIFGHRFAVDGFTLSNKNNVRISILNFGCVVYEIIVPDKDGNFTDINLGFSNVLDYESNNNYFGALCGRVANRIGNAQFSLDGNNYTLSKNDPFAGNFVHGGYVGFSRRVWSWSIKDDKLILHYVDPDGSEGMPGEVIIYVTFTLCDDNTLTMDYKATTNAPTVIDMGSHFMVNLAGHGKGQIKDHVITIASDTYLEMGSDFLPTGKKISVDDDKQMDFRNARSLQGDVLEQLSGGCAFHHAFVYDKSGEKKFMARVDHPDSKRYMEVYSTNTTVFAYSNHFMKDIMKDKPCKDDVVYEKYAAIEFMPMGYPNSINVPNFPQSVVRPDGEYRETAWYKFGVSE